MRLTTSLWIVSATICALAMAAAAHAVTNCPVPSAAYPTIQKAINSAECQCPFASEGGVGRHGGSGPSANYLACPVIVVAPGTYFEHLKIIDRVVRINGAGSDKTFIDGSHNGRVVLITATQKVPVGCTDTSIQWQASTTYVTGDAVIPTTGGNLAFVAQNGGTSGSTEPTWPVTAGATVQDNDIIWKAVLRCQDEQEVEITDLTIRNGVATGNDIPTGDGAGILIDGPDVEANGATIPIKWASTEAPGSSNDPFNCTGSQRYQQVYDRNTLEAGKIETLSFRLDGSSLPFIPETLNGVTIKVSTTPNPPDGLSTNFAANEGPDAVTVFSGSLTLETAGSGFDILVEFDTPFKYDPAKGHLLVDITIPNCGPTAPFDAASDLGDPVSRVVANNSGAATGTADTGGLITEIGFVPVAEIVAEPAVVLTNVVVDSNRASLDGGGISHNEAGLDMTNVCVTNNVAAFAGGGIWSEGSISGDTVYVAFNKSQGPEGQDCIQVWPPKWQPNHAYTVGDQVIPTKKLLELGFEAQNSGTSGATEPKWPTEDSGQPNTIVDGTITWKKFPLIEDACVPPPPPGPEPPDGDGGGVENLAKFECIDCTFEYNVAEHDGGGGIHNGKKLDLMNCTVNNNRAIDGAGIDNSKEMEIQNTTIAFNVAFGKGAGTAEEGGGGVNQEGHAEFTDVTIAFNQAPTGSGGGVAFPADDDSQKQDFKNSIIAFNVGGNCRFGDAQNEEGEPLPQSDGANIDTENSCLFGLKHCTGDPSVMCTTDPDCSGVGGPCTTGHSNTPDLINTDPKLFPLANYGGPTKTFALHPMSPAIDLVAAGQCNVSEDQRHFMRPAGASCDSGAFEKQMMEPLGISTSNASSLPAGQRGTYTITIINANSGPITGTVTVTEMPPAGVSVAAISGPGWGCNLATLTCTRSDTLAAGASYPPITVVASPSTMGAVTFKTTVTGGGKTNTASIKRLVVLRAAAAAAPAPALDRAALAAIALLLAAIGIGRLELRRSSQR